jgi:hypothetical protein
MYRSFALALAAGLALAAPLVAAPINTHEIADFQTGNGPVTNVGSMNTLAGGFTFTNNLTRTDVQFAQPSTIVAVGTSPILFYNRTTGDIVQATYNGQPLMGVLAIQGTVPAQPGAAAVVGVFDQGRVGFFIQPEGYNRFDPASWGLTDAAGNFTDANLIAQFGFKPQEAISPGGSGFQTDVPVPAGGVNVSAINVVDPGLTQGNFLFRELAGGILGEDWMTITTGDIPGATDRVEALHIRSDQGTALADEFNTAFIEGGAGTASFDALNAIAQGFGGLALFATDFSNDPSQGDPLVFAPATAFLNSPDVMATLGITAYPTLEQEVEIIPEPASLAVFGLLAGVGGLVYRKRRNKAGVTMAA